MASGTTTPGAGPPRPTDVRPATVAPAGDPHDSGPEGRPLVLLAYVCGFTVVALLHGLDETLGVVAGVLNIVFGVYFCRHLGFAVAAARWAENDMLAADVGLHSYTPSVAVFVPSGRPDKGRHGSGLGDSAVEV